MQADIEAFSTENELTIDFVSTTLHKYFVDPKAVTKEYLRIELSTQGVKGLIRLTAYIEKLQEFMNNSYNKFTAEGE